MEILNKKPQTLITVTIESRDYLLPEGRDLKQVLEILTGMRSVRLDSYHYLNPSCRVAIDGEEAEVSVTSSRRRLVTKEEARELKKADDVARADEEKEKAVKNGGAK